MVKDHSDCERGNPLLPHRLLFPISSKVFLYASSHRQDNTYHILCYTSRGALAGTRNSSMGPPHEGSIRRPIAPWANAFTMELHLAPLYNWCNVLANISVGKIQTYYTNIPVLLPIQCHYGIRNRFPWLVLVESKNSLSLEMRSGLEPIPRCEPSTYQPISRWQPLCQWGRL